jgi:phosphoribosylglycinamide formyltransferase 1
MYNLSKKSFNIAVLASGNGSNLEALLKAEQSGVFPGASIAVVFSDKKAARALDLAREYGKPAIFLGAKGFPIRAEYDAAVTAILQQYHVKFVCLAGYMRLVSSEFVAAWQEKMVNIHPSLLPSFKGLYAIRQALNYGVKITGCTVHYVTEDMDAGPILAQAAVPVLAEDSEESLSARVLEQEHLLYVEVMRKICAEHVH